MVKHRFSSIAASANTSTREPGAGVAADPGEPEGAVSNSTQTITSRYEGLVFIQQPLLSEQPRGRTIRTMAIMA